MRPFLIALWMGLLMGPTLGQAQGFKPFDAGEKHPFVGQADHVPGDGPKIVLPRPLNAPDTQHIQRASAPATRLSSSPLYLAALFYRNYLTKVDGPRCGHYPTCSHFANQAVARHGGWGILMGLERLIRNGRSSMVRWLPEIGSGYSRRYYDPVDNYIIWRPENFTGFELPHQEDAMDLPALPIGEDAS